MILRRGVAVLIRHHSTLQINRCGDIQRLVECLEENGYCLMLGKSRTAEYGSCEFHITKPSAVERKYGNSACGKDWLVWLISPFVSMSQESGLFETEAGPLMEEMSKGKKRKKRKSEERKGAGEGEGGKRKRRRKRMRSRN